MLGLIARNCSRLPTKTGQNSLKNLSGDIWVVLKTELAIILMAAIISNGMKGKKEKTIKTNLKTSLKLFHKVTHIFWHCAKITLARKGPESESMQNC